MLGQRSDGHVQRASGRRWHLESFGGGGGGDGGGGSVDAGAPFAGMYDASLVPGPEDLGTGFKNVKIDPDFHEKRSGISSDFRSSLPAGRLPEI